MTYEQGQALIEAVQALQTSVDTLGGDLLLALRWLVGFVAVIAFYSILGALRK